MRDLKRIKEILDLIEILWKRFPDQRLGQLLFNYTRFGSRAGPGIIKDIFFYEDHEIKEDLEKMLNKELKDSWT